MDNRWDCVKLIQQIVSGQFEKRPHMVSMGEPLGMVIAYVDDLIAVGQQEQLDGMKASLDALYTMKTSGTVPAEHTPGVEPLKFLGCFIERISTGEIVMHQRSYIEHCLKNNEMTHLKAARSLPCVDEKSPPEDAYDEHGHPTSFEEVKSMCQKYIGQLMWLTTRTRPDIAAVLGILASQMVIRPTYIKGCLIHLWRYVLGTIDLDMYSFEPAPMQYGSLILNVYVDASFASGADNSAVLAPVCLACQEGQVQVRKSESMCIMFCHRSHYMVQDKANKKKGRPGGEAPEGQAHAHGPGPGVKQKQEIAEARMKALQHTEVPSSSTSSASKSTKAQGKTSQPKRGMTSSKIDQTTELETSQATATESSASASAVSRIISISNSISFGISNRNRSTGHGY